MNDNTLAGRLYLDASFGYEFDVGDTTMNAYLNVNNLLDKDPAIGGSAQTYDTLGRMLRAGIRFNM